MIDKKRLYLMIGISRFEQKNRDKEFRVNNYYQRDYLVLAMIGNFILTTLGYAMVLAMIALYNMETVLANLNSLNIRPLVAALIVSYLIFLGVYTVIALIRAKLRYVRMESDMEQYEHALDRISRIYKEEERERSINADDDYQEDEDE
ncbi:MAG: hypothetical protein Q4B22_04640 [Eubacteriales bacterium]|nr:hypothetical protein [Eubacteriales bacterium]